MVGFLPPTDERVRSTVAAVERHLMVDGLVLRYRTEDTEDGLPVGEGAFLPCSFWYAETLVLLGRIDEAQALFERLIGLCNDVGLLSEEYDPRTERMLGNFLQAFSHLALVNAALRLAGAPRTKSLRRRTNHERAGRRTIQKGTSRLPRKSERVARP